MELNPPPTEPAPQSEPSQRVAMPPALLTEREQLATLWAAHVANQQQLLPRRWERFKANLIDYVITLLLAVVFVGIVKLYDRQSDMQSALTGHTEKFTSLDTRIMAVGGRIDSMSERIDRADERIGRLEARVDRVEQKLDKLTEAVSAVSVTLTRIEAKLPAPRGSR